MIPSTDYAQSVQIPITATGKMHMLDLVYVKWIVRPTRGCGVTIKLEGFDIVAAYIKELQHNAHVSSSHPIAINPQL